LHQNLFIAKDPPFNFPLNKGGYRRQGDQIVLNVIRKNATYFTAGIIISKKKFYFKKKKRFLLKKYDIKSYADKLQ